MNAPAPALRASSMAKIEAALMEGDGLYARDVHSRIGHMWARRSIKAALDWLVSQGRARSEFDGYATLYFRAPR